MEISASHWGQRSFCRNSVKGMSPRVRTASATSTSHERLHSLLVQNARSTYLPWRREESSTSSTIEDCDTPDSIADDIMTGPAASFTAVMVKARTAQHWTMARAQASVMEPRVFAEMFGIVAADLEILLEGAGAGREARS